MIDSTLAIAEGAIEPSGQQLERYSEVIQRVVNGEFYARVDTPIVVGCIDGRNTAEGISLKPTSAGGSLSLFVADDITTKRFAGDDDSTAGSYAKIIRHVLAAGYPVGGHTDNHAHGTISGCGASDKLPMIYDFIVRHGDVLRGIAVALGATIPDEDYVALMKNAASRQKFSSPALLLEELRSHTRAQVDNLVGDHNEVVVAINTKENTTLDRNALQKECGSNYQVFNVDVWAFQKSAELLSGSLDETKAKVFALTMYNLATAGVLCGNKMRVVSH